MFLGGYTLTKEEIEWLIRIGVVALCILILVLFSGRRA